MTRATSTARHAPILEKSSVTYRASLNPLDTSTVERTGEPRAIPGNVGQSIGPLVLSVALTALPAIACSAADGAAETDAAEG